MYTCTSFTAICMIRTSDLICCVFRSLVAYLGAANQFSKDHIDKPENRELMEKAHYFYMAVSTVSFQALQ